MPDSYKMWYYIDPNYDDLIGRVKKYLEWHLLIERDKKYVLISELRKAFHDVPPILIWNAISFLVDNGMFYVGYSRKYKEEFVAWKPRVDKEVVEATERLREIADKLGGVDELVKQVVIPKIEEYISKKEQNE